MAQSGKKKRKRGDEKKKNKTAANTPGDGGRFIGIDIGGTKLHAVVAEADGSVIATARKRTRPELGFEGVMARVVEVVHEACEEAAVSLDTLEGVGVGAPSPIRPDGTAVNAPNLGWRDAPLVATLSSALGRPVTAANDCDAGTFGELVYGAGKNARTLVGLFMGTGLGGGLVINGRPVCGINNMAAEIGHMIVVVDGKRCGCGHRGCLEAYASKTGLGKYIACQIACEGRETALTKLCDGDYSSLRSSVLAHAYNDGDELAVEGLHRAARFLGIGTANLITLLGPDVVVLGGGVMEALGTQLIDHVKAAAEEHAFPPGTTNDTRLCLAALGDDAVALGAVAWARAALAAG